MWPKSSINFPLLEWEYEEKAFQHANVCDFTVRPEFGSIVVSEYNVETLYSTLLEGGMRPEHIALNSNNILYEFL